MKKVLVLGAGQMGSVIVRDLVESGYEVDVADAVRPKIPGAKSIVADLSKTISLKSLMGRRYDVVVGALPSYLGANAIQSAISMHQNYVDLSYCTEDIVSLHDDAVLMDSLVVPDCGVAPGLSNLLTGRAINKGHDTVKVYVGGFAIDPTVPLGYAVSWSIEDLLDEFVRPARIIQNGEVQTVPAMSGVEQLTIPGVGDLEAFYTDGLRSLLKYQNEDVVARKATIVEKTMRRAGHLPETLELVKNGTFVNYMKDNCMGHRDTLVMRVEADGNAVDMRVDADDVMSAMARTTALSCSAFAQMVADGEMESMKGVLPPEVFSEDENVYKHILDKLAEKGIAFTQPYPFL